MSLRPSAWLLFPLLLAALSSGALHAHQGSLAFWTIEAGPEAINSKIVISLLDLNFLKALDRDEDGLLDYDEVVAKRVLVEEKILQHFLIRNDGQQGTTEVRDLRVLKSGNLELSVRHRFGSRLGVLEIESTLFELTDDQHQTLCRIGVEGEFTEYMLSVRNPVERIEILQGWPGLIQRMGRFLKLGVEHIFTGYDHLAFLVGLIVLGGPLSALVGVVSSFTVAHSLTLILATLDIVVLPTPFVETAIALSICYIALENMFVREIKYRWVITFFFGLIHGFGFSNILRQMELPRSGLFTSLLSFNLGVEIGQILIILVIFPLILYVSRKSWHPLAITLTSSIILALGGFWFVERIAP